MPRPLLVLRPEPGASRTATRAAALGLEALVVPLFEIVARDWAAPDPAGFDALMITSANAIEQGGNRLKLYANLPVYAVGEATAQAARGAGFTTVHKGPGDANGLIDGLRRRGVARVLHLCGADRLEPDSRGIAIERIAVYAARPIAEPAGLGQALAQNPVAMLHSPRAAARLAALAGDRRGIALVAISRNAAEAAGGGWERIAIAKTPDDQALLAIAASLCKQVAAKT